MDDDNDYVLKSDQNDKNQDHYPQWMKDLTSKQKLFSDRLQSVQDKQKKLVIGLDKFGNKQAEQEKQKIQRANEEDILRQKKLQIEKLKYHEYYLNNANENNKHNKALKLNYRILNYIIEFDSDPIILMMKMRRVCKKWCQLLDLEYGWANQCKIYLGEQFYQLNLNESLKQDKQYYWKFICYYFRKGLKRSQQYFYRYEQIGCPTEFIVQDKKQVQESIFVIEFLQQVLSIQAQKSQLILEFLKLIKKIGYSLSRLSQSSHFFIQQEARNLLISVCLLNNQIQTKIIRDETQQFILKQMLNQCLFSKLNDQIIFAPTIFRYSFTDEQNESIFGQLRNGQDDLKKLNQIWSNQQKHNAKIYFYDRYGDNEEVQGFNVSLVLNKQGDIAGYNCAEEQQIKINGHLDLQFKNIFPIKYQRYDQGITVYAEGKIMIETQESNLQFDCKLNLIYKFKDDEYFESLPVIGGNFENRKIFIILFQQ